MGRTPVNTANNQGTCRVYPTLTLDIIFQCRSGKAVGGDIDWGV